MPVLAAAFCPHPPLLVPELAGAAAPELDHLRGACDEAVAALMAYDVPVLVLGPAPGPGRPTTYGPGAAGSLAPWGADLVVGGGGPPELPLSLTIGAWLLDRTGAPVESRGYLAVSGRTDDHAAEHGVVSAETTHVLLVMGDASATRTAKAPGGFDPAAEAFDARVSDVLGRGEGSALAAVGSDPACVELGVAGAPAWLEAARRLPQRPADTAQVLADEAPYGVGYLVALWTWAA